MDFNKEKSYYQHVRDDLLRIIPSNAKMERVLEIGCGDGSTAMALRSRFFAQEIIGIDVNASLSEWAAGHLDRFIPGDIEKMALDFEPLSFDCIIFADVLEHLYDPWRILKKMRPLLKDDGRLLVSIPNIQHFSTFRNLLFGNWIYEKEGLLDSTHIRFFTGKSIRKSLEKAGFKIINMSGVMGKDVEVFDRLTLRLFHGFLSYRYFILAGVEKT